MTAPLRHALVATGVFAVVAAAAVAPPQHTLASWASPETATGSYSAITLPPPSSASCTTTGIPIVHTEAKVTWSAPAGGPPTGTRYELRATNVSVTPNVTTSTTMTGTTYSFSDGLLGSGLLLGLLSGSSSLRVQVFTVPSASALTGWQSTPVPTSPIVVTYSGGLLSGNFSC
jgi:hypothetical protein